MAAAGDSRYARHLVLPEVGPEGQLILQESSVLVVGAGGLGSPALLYLAAAGIGRIGLIDDDTVDVTNLQRQIIHGTSEVGESKAASAERRISDLNPEVTVEAIEGRLNVTNALEIIGRYDLVIDGTDNFETRYLIGDACEILGKPWIFGSIHRFEGQVATFNLEGGPNYRDLFPKPPEDGLAPNCAEAGVLGVLPGIVGSIQATEAIKVILEIGDTLNGKLLVIDALSMKFRTLGFSKNESRGVVTELTQESAESCSSDVDSPSGMMLVISPSNFVQRRDSGWDVFLLDVRRSEEEAIATLSGTDLRIEHNLVPMRMDEIPLDKDIVVYCRTGSRSAAVARYLVSSGLAKGDVYNLQGGIHEWSDTVNPNIIKY
ncbi:MAG: molybdopterin-synthase adenylyltransferase MoeB [Candidatus Thermoplasmatota archaeon]|nr:molybdopterin-synthase adenylyltransferase MoeB [Candidatus Thermoplasmatota archaeon]|tara:strand:+ start:1163 stop:2287 length:1125 start_codon:yes stop_codon:yes gene_type:complete